MRGKKMMMMVVMMLVVGLGLCVAGGQPERVMYFLFVDRFYDAETQGGECLDKSAPNKFHGGDVAGIANNVGYLKELGVKSTWITPLGDQVRFDGFFSSGCGYHGYWPNHTVADGASGVPRVDARFGTASGVSGMLKTLHNNDITVILDFVLNHAGYNAQAKEVHPEWFHAPVACENNPGADPTTCSLYGLPDYMQELSGGAVTRHLLGLTDAWLTMPWDGMRVDAIKHIPLWFLKDYWVPKIRAIKGAGFFLLGENFDYDNRNSIPLLNAGVDSLANFQVYGGLRDTFARDGSTSVLAGAVRSSIATLGYATQLKSGLFLDNHDVPRFVTEVETKYGADATDQMKRERLIQGLSALLTLPGVPILFYGTEIGMRGESEWLGARSDMPVWAFSAAGRAANPAPSAVNIGRPDLVFDAARKLIALRNARTALQTGSYTELWYQSPGGSDVFAYARGNGIFVVHNNGWSVSDPMHISIAAVANAPADGTVLRDSFGGAYTTTITDRSVKPLVPAKTSLVLEPSLQTSASAVSFSVWADTSYGQSIYLAGSIPALHSWDTTRAISCSISQTGSGSRNKWSVTLKYLPYGTAIEFKFIKRSNTDPRASATWQSGDNRRFTVSSSPSAIAFDGDF